jgi:hypothetical protein
VIDTLTIWTDRIFTKEDILEKLNSIDADVLRVKGIVRKSDGYLRVNCKPGIMDVTGRS